MPAALDITGQTFNYLTAIEVVETGVKRKWLCRCRCGNESVVATSELTQGKTKSCGCYVVDHPQNYRHGMKGTRVYGIWKHMRRRCLSESCKAYPEYGGRGITICKEWMDFVIFYRDMGDPPSDEHSIDRIDNNGGYSKDNCRWASRKTQNRNRRDNRIITINGESKCLAEWSEITGLSRTTISSRLRRGWSTEEAMQTKPRGK